jgi:predicted nucleic acid-binding protein
MKTKNEHSDLHYDCVYIALAERENCEFVTADEKLVNQLRPLFPFIVSLASLP